MEQESDIGDDSVGEEGWGHSCDDCAGHGYIKDWGSIYFVIEEEDILS